MNPETAQRQPTAQDFSLRFSSTPRGARLARLLAVEQLREWGLPTGTAAQIIAELAANAVTHGRVPGRDFRLVMTVCPGGPLRIEVTDPRGDRQPVLRSPEAAGESGRGLILVDTLADRWGVTQDPSPCKTVWAEIGPPGRR